MTATVKIGPYTYDADDAWGRLPAGYRWGHVSSVAVDSHDRVYAYTRTEHPLMVFDRDGAFLESRAEGLVQDAHGMCLDADDNLYLLDRESQVALKLTPDGRQVFEIGTRGQPSDTGYTAESRAVLRAAGPFHHPTDIALSASGGFYVSDGYRNARVHKFSDDGTLLFSWGEPGDGPGQFNLPHSVWEAHGRVYVADRQNNRLQVFTTEGGHLETWTGFLQPCKIFVDGDDLMYVAELQGRVSLLRLDGTVMGSLGGLDEQAAEPGKFVAPHGIWADSHGDLYVSEVLEGQRLQKFVRR